MGHEAAAAPVAAPKAHDAGANNIRVAVRIRPFNAREVADGGEAGPVIEVAGNTVTARNVDKYGFENDYQRTGLFGFDAAFDSVDKSSPGHATQAEIFESIGLPLLENALNAYNGCLLAYGQTGAGKSYSMLGDPHNETEKGLLPRACDRLFEMVGRQCAEAKSNGKQLQAAILASYLEIYQEKMYDLLVNTRTDLQVRLHPTLGPHVPSLLESPVTSMGEIHELLDFGAKNRAVGATTMNANSSRSHAVFTIDLRLTYSGKDLQSKIHFVDLAGSERQKKTEAKGERLQEGIAINQSLSALSRVIQALAGGCPRTGGKQVQPPFRESKLTLLLKDALSGNSRTVLLACISPARANLDESISTLEFAQRCKLVKTNAKKNEQDKRDLINALSEEKQQIMTQLELEMKQRNGLQQELEREMEQSKLSQEMAERMREEKLAIERQLHTLESQTLQNAANEQHQSALQRVQLKQTEQELQLVRQAQEAKQTEWEKLQRENEQKAQDMMRLQIEQEKLVEEQHRVVREAEELRQDKERQVAQAEAERQEALQRAENTRVQQEEEQREWAERHRDIERRAQELREALDQRETDRTERERLELEHRGLLEKLRLEREEKSASMREAQRLQREREEQLGKLNEDRKQAAEQLEALRKQQAAEQAEWERRLAERERQAQELQQLRNLEVTALEQKRKEVEEREKANREWHEREVERIEREKVQQLSQAEEERRQAMAELKEKLAAMQRQEEEERQRAAETQRQNVERLEQEMRRREMREEDLKKELAGLHDLSRKMDLEKQDLEKLGQEQKLQREQLMKELGIVGMDPSMVEPRTQPRLVNLHPDPMLEGCLIYYLLQGETRIGADPQRCRVCLTGLDVAPEVCAITNTDHEQVTVSGLPGGLVRVNGAAVTTEGQRLANGDRLAIGRAHIFRVVVPRDAQHRERCRNSQMDRDEEEFSRAMEELQQNAKVDPRWSPAIDAAVLAVKGDYGTREANALLDASRIASDNVAMANALLQRMPKEWRHGVGNYELAVLSQAEGPPEICVVARGSEEPERSASDDACDEPSGSTAPQRPQRAQSLGIWEASRFCKERLEEMQEAVEISDELTEDDEPKVDDWEPHVWSELLLHEFRDLALSYQELAQHCRELEDRVNQESSVGDWLGGLFGGGRRMQSGREDQKNPTWSEWSEWLFGNRRERPDGGERAGDPHGENQSPPPKHQAPQRQRTLNLAGAGSTANRLSRATSVQASSRGSTGGMKPKVNVRPARDARGASMPPATAPKTPTRASSFWPAADPEDLSPGAPIAVGSQANGSGRKWSTPMRGSHAGLSSRIDDTEVEAVDIFVGELFQGRLGVRLRTARLVVAGFDVPEAKAVGWCLDDEIIAVNGKMVHTKEDFRRELAGAQQALPITFTVHRHIEPSAGPRRSIRMDTE